MTTLIKAVLVWCCAMKTSKALPDLRSFAATDENTRRGIAEKVADGKSYIFFSLNIINI